MGPWGADFDPDRLADLETAMWKAYYRHQPARLFGLLIQGLREQGHASWPRAVAADRWLEPLSRERRARYYAETVPIGRAFGIPAGLLPADLDAFEAYVQRSIAPDGPLRVGPVARELADAVLHPPLGPILPALGWLPSRLYAWTLWPSVGLLPPTLRVEYGLAWGPVQRAVASWLVATWRWWRPILPADFRLMPAAVAADRRLWKAQPGIRSQTSDPS